MPTYVAILRGINVSGQKKIPMAELRQILERHEWKNLKTYIQSGNVVFETTPKDPLELSGKIAESIMKQYGFEVPVITLTAAEIRSIIDANPFANKDLSKVHVTFLAIEPDPGLVKQLPVSNNPKEAYRVMGKAVYVYCPDGYGRTKIHNMFFEKKLKVTATTRNWKTCLQLAAMTAGK